MNIESAIGLKTHTYMHTEKKNSEGKAKRKLSLDKIIRK